MKRFLLGICFILNLISNAIAAHRVFEKANVLYRPIDHSLDGDLGHTGLYLNNKSNYQATAAQFTDQKIPDILNSDDKHCVIHSAKSIGVRIDSFNSFLSSKNF